MKALRHLAIERGLADWFRRDGWNVSGSRASKNIDDELGEVYIELDLSDLANDLDAELDRISGEK